MPRRGFDSRAASCSVNADRRENIMNANAERAAKADRVVANYSDDTDDLGEALSDLLGDLRHFADAHGIDFAERDREGYRGYLLELAEGRKAEAGAMGASDGLGA